MTDAQIDPFIALRKSVAPPIEARRDALLVIDMQNYQIRKDWGCYESVSKVAPGMLDEFMDQVRESVEPKVRRLVAAARKADMLVVYTKFSSNHRDGRDLAPQLQEINAFSTEAVGKVTFPYKDAEGSNIVEGLTPEGDDMVIVKTTSGAFTCTDLGPQLKNAGIEQIVVCGVVTNMCVEGTARAGSELGFHSTIVGDASAAWSERAHEASLRSFGMFFGSVLGTEEVLGMLDPPDEPVGREPPGG